MRKLLLLFSLLNFLFQPLGEEDTLRQVKKASQVAYGNLPPPPQGFCYGVKSGFKNYGL